MNALYRLVAATWLLLHGPDGQIVYLNTAQITNIRAPRGEGHFGAGVRCLVFMTDSKYVGVLQNCTAVHALIEGAKQ